jgi:hypothetical protein
MTACRPSSVHKTPLRAFEKAGFTVTNTVQLAGENFKPRVVRLNRQPEIA